MYLKVWADETKQPKNPSNNFVMTETSIQIEKIQGVAKNMNFDLAEFNLLSCDLQKFKKFIEALEKKIDHPTAVLAAFYLVDGRKLDDIGKGLDFLALAKINCEITLAKKQNEIKTVQDKADIVFDVLNWLNGRDPDFEKYNYEKNLTLPETMERIEQIGLNEGKNPIAQCMSLSLLFYLTMHAIGEGDKVKLWLAEVRQGDMNNRHLYTKVAEKIYENTNSYSDCNKELSNLYAKTEAKNIWPILVEVMSGILDEKRIKTLEEKVRNDIELDEQEVTFLEERVAFLKKCRELDNTNPRILSQLNHNSQILINAYSEGQPMRYLSLSINISNVLIEYGNWFAAAYNKIQVVELKNDIRVNRLPYYRGQLEYGKKLIEGILKVLENQPPDFLEQIKEQKITLEKQQTIICELLEKEPYKQ